MKVRGILGLVVVQLVSEAFDAVVRWVTRREKPIPLKPKPSSAPAPAKPTPTASSSARTRN